MHICIQNKFVWAHLQGRDRVKGTRGDTIAVLPAVSGVTQTKSAAHLIL